MVNPMMMRLWIGLCLLSACTTEYGQDLRCGSDDDCTADRICEPIQGYCVRPGAAQPTDTDAAAMDGTVVDEGLMDGAVADGERPTLDAESAPLDAAQLTPDAAQPPDAAPMDMAEIGRAHV